MKELNTVWYPLKKRSFAAIAIIVDIELVGVFLAGAMSLFLENGDGAA